MSFLTKAVALFTAAITLIWAGQAASQEDPQLAAIDAYMCDYTDGKGAGDLMKVVEKWNKWMDSTGGAAYSAWVMTPVLASTDMDIDLVWLGAWQNGKDMGQGMQAWADKGRDLNEEFLAVIDCGEHSSAASMNIRPPVEGWPGKSGVAMFTNCTVADGKSMNDAIEVHRKWAKHMDDIGSKAGLWLFFPGAGSNNSARVNDDLEEWDYKAVFSHPDYISYGNDWESYMNGGGWRVAQEIGGGILDCDSPRLYHSVTVRDGGINPNPK